MRIIAGEFRGRQLAKPGDATRPITDRAKQSLFDVLAPLIPDSSVYDCFCGTGSMGLECLSRGAAGVTFFERDRVALRGLRQNITALALQKSSTVVAGDIFRHFAQVAAPKPVALVFIDPPYRFLVDEPEALRVLGAGLAARHVNEESTLIFRHDASDELDMPPFVRFDRRTYGSMTIDLLHLANGRYHGA